MLVQLKIYNRKYDFLAIDKSSKRKLISMLKLQVFDFVVSR